MKPRRTPSDWRRVVLRCNQITDSTRVLLIVLAEHMKPDLTVSVPRKDMARWLNRSERRIQERIKSAHEAGLLDTVVRGHKGVTAVYAGLFPEPLSGTISSTLNDTRNRHPESRFSRTHGGPTTTTADPYLGGHGQDEKRPYGQADPEAALDDRVVS